MFTKHEEVLKLKHESRHIHPRSQAQTEPQENVARGYKQMFVVTVPVAAVRLSIREQRDEAATPHIR